MFSGEKLQSLRELHGLSRKELANELQISEQAIWQYENQYTNPKLDIINQLKKKFNVKAQYFYTDSFLKSISIEEHIAYRSDDRGSRKKTKREAVYLNFVNSFLEAFEDKLDLPISTILKLRTNTLSYINKNCEQLNRTQIIENTAAMARKFLNVENNKDLLYRLELSGIYILERNMGQDIDAYSMWSTQDKAYLILGNRKKSAVRRNFDLAHELGHLLLHYRMDMNNLSIEEYNQIEKEAHLFASCFLLPREEFVQEFNHIKKKSNPDSYIELKLKYYVSIAALEYRAYKLDLVTYEEHRYFYSLLNKKGYRIIEPLDEDLPIIIPGKIRALFEIVFENKLMYLNDFLDDYAIDLLFLSNLFSINQEFFEKFKQTEQNYFSKNSIIPFHN